MDETTGHGPAGLTIEEASARTGVTAHTLRYYERIGLLDPVPRAAGGHRRYTDDDLGRVGFLTLLRQTGMSIRDMQRFVELTRLGDHTIADRVDVLVDHRARLRAHVELLTRHLAALETKIGVYRTILGTERPYTDDQDDQPARAGAEEHA
ncbi:MerR family transcriptional regulator [Cellulomonas sp. 179-A 9B4 NHS]|uniref:MerR family transcriptional regulator n=1 Tax=Cellulomonas sp. 179-A 9B4 NHS TaxID=3142379 RepID=UPI0039A14329